MYKFIDLFCGIGGFRVALERRGMECVFSSDIDRRAQESYYRNFGERPIGDISQVSENTIPKHDVLCAGFPCQPFSISGKMNGIEDARGRLFYEIIRIARYHRPAILLLENVKNIQSIDAGNTIKTIESKLNEIGYEVQKHVLNASHFGIPQKRERMYFVCIRKGAKRNTGILKYSPPKESFKQVYLEDVLEKEVNKSLYINRDDIVMKGDVVLDNQLKPIRVGIVNKGGQGERIYSDKGHAITLSAYGGGAGAKTGLYLIDNRIRRLSITECKRVMGFKDTHIVSDGTQGYQQLGNAVIPTMIEYVWNNISYKELMSKLCA